MIFLIPARAGSKRLPGKNKRAFCGLPLWEWSLATASRIASPGDSIIVSTDDWELQDTAYGVGRRADLCGDDSTTQELIEYTWGLYADESICLLQPTSPTRPDSLVRMMIARGDACRSVTNGKPNGQCYIYRKGMEMVDVETEQGHDIDTLEQFQAAEQDMMRRFA